MNLNNFNGAQNNNTNQYQNNYGQSGINNQFSSNTKQQHISIGNPSTYKVLSIISLVCGILSFILWMAAIPGIICGIIARKHIKKDILSLLGTIFSVISIVIVIFVLILQISFPLIFTYISGKAKEQQRLNHNWEVEVFDSNINNSTLDDIISIPDENTDNGSNNENSNKTTLDDIINTPSETNTETHDNTKDNDTHDFFNNTKDNDTLDYWNHE